MIYYLKDGLQLARRQSFAIGVLFLFHFIWSVLFYQFIQNHVISVMQRFPPQQLAIERVDLFLNESALLLFETKLATPFLWILFIFILARLVISPFITAGVYDSLHTEGPRGTIFIQGMKRLSGSFTLLFWLRNLLIAIPLYWLIPIAAFRLTHSDSYSSLALGLIPSLLGMMLYSSLLKLIFVYLQLARTTDTGVFQAMLVSFRHLFPICGLALVVFSIASLCSLLIFTSSLYWAGFLTLMIHLVYPLLQMALKVWGISVQYRFWREKKV
ncbi:MAG: hypothetical protein WD424_09670 [Paenibacillaceae bacterium]